MYIIQQKTYDEDEPKILGIFDDSIVATKALLESLLIRDEQLQVAHVQQLNVLSDRPIEEETPNLESLLSMAEKLHIKVIGDKLLSEMVSDYQKRQYLRGEERLKAEEQRQEREDEYRKTMLESNPDTLVVTGGLNVLKAQYVGAPVG